MKRSEVGLNTFIKGEDLKIEIPFNFPCKNEIDQISFYALLIEAVISTILEMKMLSENTFIGMKIFMSYNISIERIAHKSCYATNGDYG